MVVWRCLAGWANVVLGKVALACQSSGGLTGRANVVLGKVALVVNLEVVWPGGLTMCKGK